MEASKKTEKVLFFGKTYDSEIDFLKAMGVQDFSCSKRFKLTPTPSQEEKKAFFAGRIKKKLVIKYA